MAVKEKQDVAPAPGEQLRNSVQHLMQAVAHRAVSGVGDKVSGATEKLSDAASSGAEAAGSTVKEAVGDISPGKVLGAVGTKAAGKVKEALGGGGQDGKGGGGDHNKVTNIVESIDVGVPVDVAYDQWTQFVEFPKFMKKVESVEQVEDEKLKWKAQVFWSHRMWEATIEDQVPNERIIWKSKGEKGRVDGAVTFHELAPELTRIIVVLEYHPQGLFERTGNLWRAQGRRVRLELKHFQRHVMTQTILHPEELEGWHGEIHEGEVQDEEQDREPAADERDDEQDVEEDEG